MGPGWDQVQIASEEKVIFELAGRAAGDCAEPGEFGCSFPATALGQIGRNGCSRSADLRCQAVGFLPRKRSCGLINIQCHGMGCLPDLEFVEVLHVWGGCQFSVVSSIGFYRLDSRLDVSDAISQFFGFEAVKSFFEPAEGRGGHDVLLPDAAASGVEGVHETVQEFHSFAEGLQDSRVLIQTFFDRDQTHSHGFLEAIGSILAVLHGVETLIHGVEARGVLLKYFVDCGEGNPVLRHLGFPV